MVEVVREYLAGLTLLEFNAHWPEVRLRTSELADSTAEQAFQLAAGAEDQRENAAQYAKNIAAIMDRVICRQVASKVVPPDLVVAPPLPRDLHERLRDAVSSYVLAAVRQLADTSWLTEAASTSGASEPGWSIGVLRRAAQLLPPAARPRWIEEWRAELSVLETRRGRARFAWQTLRGIPRMALMFRRLVPENGSEG